MKSQFSKNKIRYFIIKKIKLGIVISVISLIIFLLSCTQVIAKIHSYWELKFSNINQQASEFSCGVAVLATLFTYYYDVPVKEEDITDEFFKKMIEEKRGISFLDMKRWAQSKGFETYGYKMNFAGLMEMLKTVTTPIIVHTRSVVQGKESLHFTLLIGIVDDYFILNDTSFGNILISIDDFLSKWTGYALIIIPVKDSKRILEEIAQKIKTKKMESTKYVSKIYFYQNHPKRFYNSLSHF